MVSCFAAVAIALSTKWLCTQRDRNQQLHNRLYAACSFSVEKGNPSIITGQPYEAYSDASDFATSWETVVYVHAPTPNGLYASCRVNIDFSLICLPIIALLFGSLLFLKALIFLFKVHHCIFLLTNLSNIQSCEYYSSYLYIEHVNVMFFERSVFFPEVLDKIVQVSHLVDVSICKWNRNH